MDTRITIPKKDSITITEIEIMKIMSRATIPQTGWHVYQKLKKIVKNPKDGNELIKIMISLEERGFLVKVGSDADCGYLFKMPDLTK